MALWRIRATVDDRPGYLSVLTASLALRSVNILAVQVHTTEAGAVDDFLVDAPDTLTEADLHGAIARGRGRDAFVARAEAEGLVDQPTRALGLAGRLVHDPDALGEALVALLDATEVRWRPEPLPGRPGYDDRRMTLSDPDGGSYEVLRDRPGFTPAEYARAQALVELSGTVVRHQQERTTLLLADGAELTVRPAGHDDLDEVGDLHDRASAATLRSRYLAGGAPSRARLARLLTPAGGRTLLAVAGSWPWPPWPPRATSARWPCWSRTAGSGAASAPPCCAASWLMPNASASRPWSRTPPPTTWRCCARCGGWAPARPTATATWSA
jgi:hypothetical protein